MKRQVGFGGFGGGPLSPTPAEGFGPRGRMGPGGRMDPPPPPWEDEKDATTQRNESEFVMIQ